MTLVMVYVILISAALAASAAVVERLVRARSVASRWIWVLALALVAPVTILVMLLPRTKEAAPDIATLAVSDSIAASAPIRAPGPSLPSVLEATDVALATAWVAATALLLLALGVGQWRVARTRRIARRGEVLGYSVLLTEDLGPAVAGVASPVVLVPRWVEALDDASQRLLLAHELEHARWRDTTLLLGGAVMTALLPWNPVVWWLTWRLRVAVELDCDRRVLAANPGVRRYVDLLLLAAGKPRFSARLLAAHFGEHASDLERRIEAMTDSRLKWRPTLLTAMAAGLLIAVACETPRPDPIAPLQSDRSASATDASVLLQHQVEIPVRLVAGSAYPRYPEILRQAGVEGEVLVNFLVDETGTADTSSLEVLRSTHDLFAVAVRKALPGMRFEPAEAGGRKVSQMVEQPFTFTLERGEKNVEREVTPDRLALAEVTVTGVPKELAFSVRRYEPGQPEPNVLIVDLKGKELRRYVPRSGDETRRHSLDDVKPDDIAAIEVYKGNTCPPARGVPCPLIVVIVKEGREGGYRAK